MLLDEEMVQIIILVLIAMELIELLEEQKEAFYCLPILDYELMIGVIVSSLELLI
jgi:hypothetical protein